MEPTNKEREFGEAARRAGAVLRAAAEELKNEQNRRKMLLHTLLDAALCAGQTQSGLTLTVLDGAAFLTVPGAGELPGNGGRTAEQLATLLLAFCRATGDTPCPPAC